MAYRYEIQDPESGKLRIFETENPIYREDAEAILADMNRQEALVQQQLESVAGRSRGLQAITDPFVGIGQGILGLGELGGDVATLLGADETGKAVSEFFGEAREGLGQALLSDPMLARQALSQQRLADVQGQGFLAEAGAALEEMILNPSIGIQTLAETIPNLIPVGGAARLGAAGARKVLTASTEQALARTAGRVGLGAGITTAAAMQGADVGMDTYNRVLPMLEERYGAETAKMMALEEAQKDAIQAAAVSAGTTLGLSRFGGATIEKALLGDKYLTTGVPPRTTRFGRSKVTTTGQPPSTLGGIGRGALGEFVQESIEEGSGPYISGLTAQQYDPTIDPTAGVGTQATIGGIMGAALGAPAGYLNAKQAQAAQAAAEAAAERRATGVMDQQKLDLPEVEATPEYKAYIEKRQAEEKEAGDVIPTPPVPTETTASGAEVPVFEGAEQRVSAPESQADLFENMTISERGESAPAGLPVPPTATLDIPDVVTFPSGAQVTKSQAETEYQQRLAKGDTAGAAEFKKRIEAAARKQSKMEPQKEAYDEAQQLKTILSRFDEYFPVGTVPTDEREMRKKELQARIAELEKRSTQYGKDQEAKAKEERARAAARTQGMPITGVIGGPSLDALGIGERATKVRDELYGIDLDTVEGRAKAKDILDKYEARGANPYANAYARRLAEMVEEDTARPEAAAIEEGRRKFELTSEETEQLIDEAGVAEQKKAEAETYVREYKAAMDANDQTRMDMISKEAASVLGARQWGGVRSGLSRRGKAQMQALQQEARGEVTPTQPDLFAPVYKERLAERAGAVKRGVKAERDIEALLEEEPSVEITEEPAGVRGVPSGEPKAPVKRKPVKPSVGVAGEQPKSSAAKGAKAPEKGRVARGGGPSVRDTGRAGAEPAALDEETESLVKKIAARLSKSEGSMGAAFEEALLRKGLEEDVAKAKAKPQAARKQRTLKDRLENIAALREQYLGIKQAEKRERQFKPRSTDVKFEKVGVNYQFNDGRDNWRVEPYKSQGATKYKLLKNGREFLPISFSSLTNAGSRLVREIDKLNQADKLIASRGTALERFKPTKEKEAPITPEVALVEEELKSMNEYVLKKGKGKAEPVVIPGRKRTSQLGKTRITRYIDKKGKEVGMKVTKRAPGQGPLTDQERQYLATAYSIAREAPFNLGVSPVSSTTRNVFMTGDAETKQLETLMDRVNALRKLKGERRRAVRAEEQANPDGLASQATVDRYNQTVQNLKDAENELNTLNAKALDEQGLARVEEGEVVGGYDSASSLLDALRGKFNRNALATAIRQGRMRIFDSLNDPNIPKSLKETLDYMVQRTGEKIAGVALPGENGPTIVLIARNITPSTDLSTLVHEAGVHAGWQQILGAESFQKTLQQIEDTIAKIAANNDVPTTPFERAVYKALQSAMAAKTPASQMVEETLAYMVDQNVNLPLIKRIISNLRSFMYRIGLMPEAKLQAGDYATLAHYAAKNYLLVKTPYSPRGKFDFMSRVEEEDKPKMTATAREAINIIDSLGRDTTFEENETQLLQRVKDSFENIGYKDDGKGGKVRRTNADYINTFERWWDKFANRAFSPESAAINEFRRRARKMGMDAKVLTGRLLEIATSQASHASAVGSALLKFGRLDYDEKVKKWVASEDPRATIQHIMKVIGSIADKHNMSLGRAEAIGHTYFEARRLNEILKKNASDIAEAAKLEATGKPAAKKKAAELRARAKARYVHMSQAEIDSALRLRDLMPELDEVANSWDRMRKNVLDVVVQSGIFSKERAERLLDNAGYVPFMRVEQIEAGKSLPEYLSGLTSTVKVPRFKGSDNPVNNTFENMIRWAEYLTEASVRNMSAVKLVEALSTEGINMAKKVDAVPRNQKANEVQVYKDGKRISYLVEDPLFVEAFIGLENVGIPVAGWWRTATDFLRKSIVLNPVFSVSQLTQDAFGAMFSSGLSPRYAFKLPFETIKEFIKTITDASDSHLLLERYGSAGHRDFSAAVVRAEIETLADMRKGKNKVMRFLEDFSMASDNAVRQAVYNLTMAEAKYNDVDLDKSDAIVRSFEIINFRRRGNHQLIAAAAQMIPFFNATMQALSVQTKVLSGEGVSATATKGEAYKNLAKIAGLTYALSVLYAMMVSGDDGYENMNPRLRDRMFVIPGTGGAGLPHRTDLFAMPKIIAEHTVRLMSDEALEDGAEFRRALYDNMILSLLTPSLTPQLTKPTLEVLMNKSMYTMRPIVGPDMENLDPQYQFDSYTSEFAKAIGLTGVVSPKMADYWMKGTFGSAYGAFTWLTDLIFGVGFGHRPAPTGQDLVASFPGMSRFMTREYGSAAKAMYYDAVKLAKEARSTRNRVQTYHPEDMEDLYADPEIVARDAVYDATKDINDQLREIRKQKNQVSLSADLTTAEKSDWLRDLNEYEQELMDSLDILEIRRAAMM